MTNQQREKMQWRMIFVSSCVESAAEAMKCDTNDIYMRMKKINMIDAYILRYYETLHSQSRDYVTKDIVETLSNWEKAGKVMA